MKDMPMTVTFCCMQFWITHTKNVCDFEGTRELVTREYQVAFELYHNSIRLSKAFDMVPHQRLLTKSTHFGIQGDTHRWIRSWLTLCTCVVADGEASDIVRAKSRVSQGTVLGPLMFLLYINNISENLTSHSRLFALCIDL